MCVSESCKKTIFFFKVVEAAEKSALRKIYILLFLSYIFRLFFVDFTTAIIFFQPIFGWHLQINGRRNIRIPRTNPPQPSYTQVDFYLINMYLDTAAHTYISCISRPIKSCNKSNKIKCQVPKNQNENIKFFGRAIFIFSFFFIFAYIV